MADLTPETYVAPPLTFWESAWRYAATLAFSLAVWLPQLSDQARHPLLVEVEVVLGVASFALVRYRRRWPLRITLIITVLGAFAFTPNGPSNLAAVSLATHRDWRKIVVYSVVSMICAAALYVTQPVASSFQELLATSFALTVGSMGWGAYIGSRRELVWSWQRRANEAEANAELLARQAKDSERARIAREMHDVLAHRITQVSLQSGALAFRQDLTADEIRDGADVIRTQANLALEELRAVLGVLRDDAGEPVDRPQPTYDDLHELIDEARATGMRVTFLNSVERTPPDPLGRAVYRLAQETLTNASKHAPGAAVSLSIAGSPAEGITVTVSNPLGFPERSTPESGYGLVGLQERMELAGGELSAGSTGRTFEVRGWLPWTT